MLTERSIINFLIWIGGLILGPYLAMSAVSGNFVPLGVVIGLSLVALLFGGLKDTVCILPVLGIFWTGNLQFLPLKLTPPDACALAVLFYYLIAYAALQRKLMKTGPMFLFLPIMIIGALVLYHEHNFGVKAMGGGQEGARGALLMLVACATYLCGVSVNTPRPSVFRWLPVVCLAATLISTIPYAVTTYLPSTAPYFYIFTNNINGGAYTEENFGTGDVVRNQGQANVGASLMTCLLAFYPIATWWRPSRWWVAVAAMGCFALVVMGGFRSAFVIFGFTVLVGTWCYYSWRTLLLLPPFALIVFLAAAGHDSGLVKLPLSAQRSLSFLPGNWDPEVLQSTEASNGFRDKIQTVYLKEEARKSPLLGNGFSFDAAEFDRLNYLARTQDSADGYYSTKIFITGKMFHIGWISVYDGVGIVGTAVFVFFGLALIWGTGRMIFGRGADRGSPLFPLRVWLFCNLLPPFIGYYTVFGDFKTAFASYCYFAIVWAHLARLDRHGYTPSVLVPEQPFDPARTQVHATT